MQSELNLISIVLFVGLIGWCFYFVILNRFHSHNTDDLNAEKSWVTFYSAFLAGFALLCFLLFVLAVCGFFTWKGLGCNFLVLSIWWLFERRYHRAIPFGRLFGRYLLFCACIGVFVAGYSRWMKPYEAVIMANDSSVYIGSAFQLTNSGRIVYEDPLVREANPQEQEAIFHNPLFPEDPTGRFVRFPHGIHLIDRAEGTVSFSFYPLFPVWLGFGLKTLGENDFLRVSNLFFVISSMGLFFLGYAVRGPLLGCAAVLLHVVFYPQIYFTLLPMSETLAQALFLSGFWFILYKMQDPGTLPRSSQLFAGLLWGCMFLTKLDSLFLCVLCLIVVFAFFPRKSEDLFQWRLFFVLILLFLCGAILYQLYNGDYLYVFARIVAAVRHNVPEMRPLMRAFEGQQRIPLTLLPLMGLMMLAGIFLLRFKGIFRIYSSKPMVRTSINLLTATVLLVAAVWKGWKFASEGRYLKWLLVYIPPAVLFAQLLLILYFARTEIKEGRKRRCFVLLVFLLVPSISYLVQPMIVAEQPWSIRRYVPLVFPLLFLISSAGAFLVFERSSLRRLGPILFLIWIFLQGIYYFRQSSFLFRERLYGEVQNQVKQIGKSFPENSIVLVPHTQAGMHFVLPFQYQLGIDALSLNLNPGTLAHKRVEETISYLKRKMREGKQLRMMLVNSDDTPGTLIYRYFSPKLEFSKNVSFLRMPPFGEFEFPGYPQKLDLNCRVFRVFPAEQAPFKSKIGYNDREAGFLNFYVEERGFRWTSGTAEIANFQFPTERKKVRIAIHTRFLPVHASHMDLRVSVNEGIAAEFLHAGDNRYDFAFDGSKAPVISRVSIDSKTFVPLEMKINQDSRTLGIPFSSLEFHTME